MEGRIVEMENELELVKSGNVMAGRLTNLEVGVDTVKDYLKEKGDDGEPRGEERQQ